MSEAQTANPNALTWIGTDAKIQHFTWKAPFCGPDIDKIEVSDSTTWNSIESSLSSQDLKSTPNCGLGEYPWENAIEIRLAELSEIIKVKTAQIYWGAITDMNSVDVICVSLVVGSNLCISSDSGRKVFDVIQPVISQGNKISISFNNVKCLSPAFLESAIGRLYDGTIRGTIDDKISFEDLSSGRRLILDDVIREAKKYYSTPDEYVAKIKEERLAD